MLTRYARDHNHVHGACSIVQLRNGAQSTVVSQSWPAYSLAYRFSNTFMILAYGTEGLQFSAYM